MHRAEIVHTSPYRENQALKSFSLDNQADAHTNDWFLGCNFLTIFINSIDPQSFLSFPNLPG
jgi:hypothetical protein